MSCPYCDGKDVKILATRQLSQHDDKIYLIKLAVCRECHESFYAVQSFELTEEYEMIRRDELQEKTGIRIRGGRHFGKRRWSSC